MIINVDIPNSPEEYSLAWEPGFTISTKVFESSTDGKSILLSMNSAGLLSLARYLLMLAQPEISTGHHYHFDEYNALEPGSIEIVIEKTD